MAACLPSKTPTQVSYCGRYTNVASQAVFTADELQTGAIIQYMIDQYDKDNELSYAESPNKYLCQQWLAFQISGQYLSSERSITQSEYPDHLHRPGTLHWSSNLVRPLSS